MTAYEREMEALKKRVRSLELRAELLAQSTTEAVHRLDERIEALEGYVHDGFSGASNLDTLNNCVADNRERIERLEHRANRIYPLDIPPSERDRQADWKRTFNAVLPEAISTTYNRFVGTAENQAAAIDYASKFADRAHGPLDAKAELCTHENYSCVKERQEVEALVKAAREVVRRNRSGLPMSDEIYDLETAANPFETVKP